MSSYEERMLALADRVQKLGEARLEACMEALDDDATPSVAFAPFCGCTTCVVREVIDAIWDEMLQARRRDLRVIP